MASSSGSVSRPSLTPGGHQQQRFDQQQAAAGAGRMDTSGSRGRVASSGSVRANANATPRVNVQRSDADSSSTGTALGDRSIQATDPGLPQVGGASSNHSTLPDDFSMRLPNGAEVFLERGNDGKGPTDLDPRVADILKKEHNGDMEAAKKSWLSKVAKVTAAAMSFVKNNKDFQAAAGFIGILTCVGVGCVFPVALVATGPFIIMFANGFIDNPMLTETPPPQQQGSGSNNAANNQGQAGNNGTTASSSTNPASSPTNPASGAGSNGSAAPQPSTTVPQPGSLPNGSQGNNLRDDLDRRLAAQNGGSTPDNQPVTHAVIDAQDDQDALRQAGAFAEAQFRIAKQQEALAFSVDNYLDGAGQTGAVGHGLEGTMDLSDLSDGQKNNIRRHLAFLTAEYQLDQFEAAGVSASPRELRLVKNLLTRTAINLLAEAERSQAGNPTKSGQSIPPKLGRDKKQLFNLSTQALGLNGLAQGNVPINHYLEPSSQGAVSAWYDRKYREIVGSRS